MYIKFDVTLLHGKLNAYVHGLLYTCPSIYLHVYMLRIFVFIHTINTLYNLYIFKNPRQTYVYVYIYIERDFIM